MDYLLARSVVHAADLYSTAPDETLKKKKRNGAMENQTRDADRSRSKTRFQSVLL